MSTTSFATLLPPEFDKFFFGGMILIRADGAFLSAFFYLENFFGLMNFLLDFFNLIVILVINRMKVINRTKEKQ